VEPLVAAESPDYDASGSDMQYRGNGVDYSSGDRGSRGAGDGSRGGTRHRIDRTPVSVPRVCSKSSFLCGSGSSSRNGKEDRRDEDDISRSFEKSSFLPDCGFGLRRSVKAPAPADSQYDDEEADEHGYIVERKGNGRNHDGSDGAGGRGAGGPSAGARGKKGGGTETIASPPEKDTVTTRLVRALEKQLKRFADPDMQLAGLI
jgi:hypothetical protein